jgi:hypothetical protein
LKIGKRIAKEILVSRIVWKLALRPPLGNGPKRHRYDLYDGDVGVPNTLTFPEPDEELVQLPDARAYRSLSRAGLLLIAAGLRGQEVLSPFLTEDPFSVGVYCAMENGPNDFNSAKQMINTLPSDFAVTYKELRSPKQYLKQLPNVPPSQLAIILGISGQLNVYQHSRFGCLHALDQAEVDLTIGAVQAALVCSAFSLEDPLLSLRASRSVPKSVILCEGAAALILVPNGAYTDWRSRLRANEGYFHGIAQDLVMLAAMDDDNDASCHVAAPSLAGDLCTK